MSALPKQVAVIDLGSNSVRLIVYERGEGDLYRQALNKKSLCRLGEDLSSTGLLSREGWRMTLDTLRDFRKVITDQGITTVVPVATAAVRMAKDGADFIKSVMRETGFDLETITGHEEARLMALGVLASIPNASGIVADLGGGSLELARVQGGTVHECASYPLGALILQAHKDGADAYIQPFLDEIRATFGQTDTLFVIGGSWRALAKAYLQDTNATRELHGMRIEQAGLDDFIPRLTAMDTADISRTFRLEPRRAELMPVAAALLHGVTRTLGTAGIIVSTAGLRDGLLYDRVIARGAAPLPA